MNDIARSIREREQAFEAQYKLDEEQNFKIRARRDKLFGAWIAEKLGLGGQTAVDYAIGLAKLDLEAAGDENMIEKIKADLANAGKNISDADLSEALSQALTNAQNSYRDEYPEALSTDHHV